MTKEQIMHPKWGRVVVTRNPRARRIVMRARPEAIHMTIPANATTADIERALDRHGDKLLCRQKENAPVPFDKEFSINAPNFRLRVEESRTANIMVAGSNGTYILHCPVGTDYTMAGTQQALRQCIKAAMKHCAGSVLPARLKTLATEHGFKYNRCTVRDVLLSIPPIFSANERLTMTEPHSPSAFLGFPARISLSNTSKKQVSTILE